MIELKNTQQLKKFKILLLGDSCIDKYKIGLVDRLSPEAPVPVVKIVEEYQLPGMSANVYNNLTTLGLDCDFITNKEIITKTRYIDRRSGQHLLRVDLEDNVKPWNRRLSRTIDSYDAVIISDYNKGFLTYEDIEYIIDQTRKPIFIDTKKPDLNRFSAEWVYVKINETEYKNKTSSSRNLIVTLGDQGAMYMAGYVEFKYKSSPVEVVDVCGCGDTFLSALTAHYLISNNIHKSIEFANIAAGITVQHRGNYAPTPKEIYGH